MNPTNPLFRGRLVWLCCKDMNTYRRPICVSTYLYFPVAPQAFVCLIMSDLWLSLSISGRRRYEAIHQAPPPLTKLTENVNFRTWIKHQILQSWDHFWRGKVFLGFVSACVHVHLSVCAFECDFQRGYITASGNGGGGGGGAGGDYSLRGGG